MSDKPKIEDGGPAFPDYSPATDEYHKGMTLRDYFAGRCLMGMVYEDDQAEKLGAGGKTYAEIYAIRAYQFADAMLKERAKQ